MAEKSWRLNIFFSGCPNHRLSFFTESTWRAAPSLKPRDLSHQETLVKKGTITTDRTT